MHNGSKSRYARAREVRAASLTPRDIRRITLPVVKAMGRQLPATRADCIDGPRPCPYLSCKHHLAFDVHPRTGSLKENFPDLQPDELEVSCSLDVADSGGATLHDVGRLLNITRERTRQLELLGLKHLREECRKRGLSLDDLMHDRAERTEHGSSDDD